MAYVEDRVIHDADAPVMETPDWVDEVAPTPIAEFVHANVYADGLVGATGEIAKAKRLHADEAFRANFEDLMGTALPLPG